MSEIANSAPRTRSSNPVHATSFAVERARCHVASQLDYLLAYAASGLTLLCGIVAFRLAHQSLGDTGLAEFALMRRVIAFIVPMLSMGMAVAIAKSVACRVADNRAADSIDFLGGGLLLSLLSISIFGLAVFLFPRQIAFVCMGTYDRVSLVQCVVPLVSGLVLTICGSAYCRGRMWIGTSNALQLVSVGIVPALVLLWVHDIESFLCWSGGAVTISSSLAIFIVYLRSPGAERWSLFCAARSLLQFGLPRVPGDMSYNGFLAAPAAAAGYWAGIQTAGEFAYALALLTLLGQLVAPLSTLLLPEATYLIHAGQAKVLRGRLHKVLWISMVITGLLAGLIAYWGREIIELHLGACSVTLLHTVRMVLVTAIPLNVFICLRSVIDAGESRAVSPRLCTTAFAAFCVAAFLFNQQFPPPANVVYAFIFTSSVLALMAIIATYRILAKSEHDFSRVSIATTID